MMWAIELEIGFQHWRVLIDAPDDAWERRRWMKMCHRLGSHQAMQIVEQQRLRDWRTATRY